LDIHSRRRKNINGFSLIELVVVVSVLSVLSAIAIPSFNCLVRKSRAVTALKIMRQIENDCLLKKETNSTNQDFINPGNINGYNFEGLEANNCQSDTTIRAVSLTDDLPSYSLEFPGNNLIYNFKGMSGRNFAGCLSLICGNANDTLSRYNIHEFVLNNAAISSDDGCSDYVIVEASSWTEAESKSNALGGNLVTINSEDEYTWLQQKVWLKNKLLNDSGNNTEQSVYYFTGLNDVSEEGKYVWSSGEASEWNNNEDLIHRQNWIAQQHMANSSDYFVIGGTNDYGFTDYVNEGYRPDLYNGNGVGNLTWVDNDSTWLKNNGNPPHFGLAEIPRCRN
tara:strand:- start:190 stop:1200 length:1011 start_codon:yes stop_codon:yes gene_type:complete